MLHRIRPPALKTVRAEEAPGPRTVKASSRETFEQTVPRRGGRFVRERSADPVAQGETCRGAAAHLAIAFAAVAVANRGPGRNIALDVGRNRNCAPCHAIGSIGESRHLQAPLFRTLASRYPVESLEEALGEGIISGHPDMPEFRFSGEDVGAIVIYLKSIQEH